MVDCGSLEGHRDLYASQMYLNCYWVQGWALHTLCQSISWFQGSWDPFHTGHCPSDWSKISFLSIKWQLMPNKCKNVLAVAWWGRPWCYCLLDLNPLGHHVLLQPLLPCFTTDGRGAKYESDPWFGFPLIFLGCLSTVYTLWRNSSGFKGRL